MPMLMGIYLRRTECFNVFGLMTEGVFLLPIDPR
jgi:hypothetical protein